MTHLEGWRSHFFIIVGSKDCGFPVVWLTHTVDSAPHKGLSVGERSAWAWGSSRSSYIGASGGSITSADLLKGDPQPMARILASSKSLGDKVGLHSRKRRPGVPIVPLEPLPMVELPPVMTELALDLGLKLPVGLFEEATSEQSTSLLRPPIAPLVVATTPHVESSIEEWPSLPLILMEEGPHVTSMDPPLGSAVVTLSCEEVAGEPFAP
ncbi:hypothetical protein B296_00007754 [Ensete ventricosum]|uniref:Uncharacterized protein n=1 Tax=Ensete ventricosum TaxID=4639 RepID=A0A427AYX7_ENSVE|nr:hypothetical protein B296_00007754 [Ensete ventricosum]